MRDCAVIRRGGGCAAQSAVADDDEGGKESHQITGAVRFVTSHMAATGTIFNIPGSSTGLSQSQCESGAKHA
jgi:hypothetical protein